MAKILLADAVIPRNVYAAGDYESPAVGVPVDAIGLGIDVFRFDWPVVDPQDWVDTGTPQLPTYEYTGAVDVMDRLLIDAKFFVSQDAGQSWFGAGGFTVVGGIPYTVDGDNWYFVIDSADVPNGATVAEKSAFQGTLPGVGNTDRQVKAELSLALPTDLSVTINVYT